MSDESPTGRLSSKQLKALGAAAKAMEDVIANEIDHMTNGVLPKGITPAQVNLHAAHLVVAQQIMAYYQLQFNGEYMRRRSQSVEAVTTGLIDVSGKPL